MGNEKDGTQQLVGDFNGDGLVDMEDFNTFINCMKHSGKDIMDFCVDKEVFVYFVNIWVKIHHVMVIV